MNSPSLKQTLCILSFVAVSFLASAQPLSLRWAVVQNDALPGVVESRLTITNLSSDTLTADGRWLIGGCFASVHPYAYEGQPLEETEVCATYHTFRPTPHFLPLLPGESREYKILQRGAIIRQSNALQGAFFVDSLGQPSHLLVTTEPFSRPEQYTRKNAPGYADGERIFAYNAEIITPQATSNSLTSTSSSSYQSSLSTVSKTSHGSQTTPNKKEESAFCFRPLPLVPQPKSTTPSAVPANLHGTIVPVFVHPAPLSSEAKACGVSGDAALPDGWYKLRFSPDSIVVFATTVTGRFYAMQTLERLRESGLPIYASEIVDWPDLPHRGLMLDIARNFTSKEEIFRILDAMALYKLNVLHFHIADDEGWRLEIPGLPELTEVGSRRGYTLDENECLYPAYCGGWDATDTLSTANGFLTREDYIRIVRYAGERHIRIIPEVDMPGHSRAAIKAMEARFRRYAATDLPKAEEYRLIDPADTSRYSSAQYYSDNVLCIARPSVYTFVDKIIDEIEEMHQSAGYPLTAFHVGGDEVAHGAWEGSPLCQSFMKQHSTQTTHAEDTLNLTDAALDVDNATLSKESIADMRDYFIRHLAQKLQSKGIQIAGWEDIALRGGKANEQIASYDVLTWCWNSIPEWKGDEIAYRLANANYPVVLACVGNNYLDMAYTNHEEERGLNWGGYTDERSTFDFLPFDIYRSVRWTLARTPRDLDAYDSYSSSSFGSTKSSSSDKVRLLPSKYGYIRGVNGQLFSETIRSNAQLEQYLFPKLIGLAERAWNAVPLSYIHSTPSFDGLQSSTPSLDANLPALQEYSPLAFKEATLIHDSAAHVRFEAERLEYFQQMYLYELPRLAAKGLHFHLPQPGIHVEQNLPTEKRQFSFRNPRCLVQMNSPIPGAVIRYTTDGSLPSAHSKIYRKPFCTRHPERLRARLFYLSEASATTRVSTIPHPNF